MFIDLNLKPKLHETWQINSYLHSFWWFYASYNPLEEGILKQGMGEDLCKVVVWETLWRCKLQPLLLWPKFPCDQTTNSNETINLSVYCSYTTREIRAENEVHILCTCTFHGESGTPEDNNRWRSKILTVFFLNPIIIATIIQIIWQQRHKLGCCIIVTRPPKLVVTKQPG